MPGVKATWEKRALVLGKLRPERPGLWASKWCVGDLNPVRVEPVPVASPPPPHPHPRAQGTPAVTVLTAATRSGVSPRAGTELAPRGSGRNPVALRAAEMLSLPFYGSGN